MLTLKFNQKAIEQKIGLAENAGFPMNGKFLTPQQQETLFDILSGLGPHEVAARKKSEEKTLSSRTVEAHRAALYEFCGVASKYGLIAHFFECHNDLGEIPEDEAFENAFNTFSASLTPKEHQTLLYLLQGLAHAEIASLTKTSHKAPEAATGKIYNKAKAAGICQEKDDLRVRIMVFLNFMKQKHATKTNTISFGDAFW